MFDGSASAVISLSETLITATNLNNGTINGNFTKYAWQIAGSNLDSTSLHYSVYARTDYKYYPAIKVVLQYSGSSSSIDGVHLSVKNAQSVGVMYDEELGAYYSYNVIKDSKHYIVTFPMQSIVSGTTQMREIYIIQLDGTSALQVTGQWKNVKNYELVLNDIIDGIYFETDNKPTNASLTTSFQVSAEPKY